MTRERNRFPTTYLAPVLVLAALLWAAPLTYALVLSLTDATPGQGGQWIGGGNFVRALADGRFRHSLLVSFAFAAGAAASQVGAGFLLALALRRRERARAITQVALLLPWVLSELAVALIWRGFLDEHHGWVNLSLAKLGAAALPWRTGAFWAMGSLWLASLWQGLAFSAMLQMAGLAALPENLVQAAKLDGASRWLILRGVIWPHQRRILAANVLLVFLMSMVSFALPFALTGGGPLFATELSSLYAYQSAFAGHYELGFAAAQGMLILVVYAMLAAFLLSQRRSAT